MSAACPHCGRDFYATRGLFGTDAASVRDAHAVGCEDNPRNKCFCGKVFPSAALRDGHATVCARNPANRYKCPYCPQEFVTTFGVMGFKSCDGRPSRDAHALACQANPANKCFCGQLFPNPDARNAHANRCVMNPSNRFECQFCKATFVNAFTMFGFRSSDGRSLRDAHQVGCERNPRNACFCGRLFPNPDSRDRHAATCEANPANRFECQHCKELFVTRYRMLGIVASDGKALRNTHELGCRKNPANRCFCGQLFPNPDARDAHAQVCEMNPANRFSCQYCNAAFVTTFGVFTACGSVQRSAHMRVCSKNPANATCEHCNATFTDAQGVLKFWPRDPRRLCAAHVTGCPRNPRNRFACERCGCCFVTGRHWGRRVDGEAALAAHCKVCDAIPCDYQVASANGFEDWTLLGLEHLSVRQAPSQHPEDLESGEEEDGTDSVSFNDAESAYEDEVARPPPLLPRGELEAEEEEEWLEEGGDPVDVCVPCRAGAAPAGAAPAGLGEAGLDEAGLDEAGLDEAKGGAALRPPLRAARELEAYVEEEEEAAEWPEEAEEEEEEEAERLCGAEAAPAYLDEASLCRLQRTAAGAAARPADLAAVPDVDFLCMECLDAEETATGKEGAKFMALSAASADATSTSASIRSSLEHVGEVSFEHVGDGAFEHVPDGECISWLGPEAQD